MLKKLITDISAALQSYGSAVTVYDNQVSGHDDYIGSFLVTVEEESSRYEISLVIEDTLMYNCSDFKEFIATLEYINQVKQSNYAMG